MKIVTAKFFVFLAVAWAETLPNWPQPNELLRAAFQEPQTAYQGVLTVNYRLDAERKTEKVRVYAEPSRHYRWERLNGRGKIERVAVSNGQTVKVYIPKSKKFYEGSAAKALEKFMSQDRLYDLVLQNYRASVVGQERLDGKTAWVLELAPKVKEKPSLRLWLQESSGLVLRAKLFDRDGTLISHLDWEILDLTDDMPGDLFELEPPRGLSSKNERLDPKLMSKEEMARLLESPIALMESLSGGFVFESASLSEFKGKSAYHLRYTDGVAGVSVLLSEAEVALAKDDPAGFADSLLRPGFYLLSASGSAVQWKKGRWHYTMIGQVSHGFLANLASSMK